MDKKEDLLKEIASNTSNHLTVAKEHKDISDQQQKQSSTKRERVTWNVTIIVVMVVIALIGWGILSKLPVFNSEEQSDYGVDFIVSPNKIMLNSDKKFQFKINFTNIGKKAIQDFEILQVELYRLEDGNYVWKSNLISPHTDDGHKAICKLKGKIGTPYNDKIKEFKVGEICSVTTKVDSCQNCFDDKDKPVQLYAYFKSNPPLENQVINLTIY